MPGFSFGDDDSGVPDLGTVFSEDDVALVVEQTTRPYRVCATALLQHNGDIVDAVLVRCAGSLPLPCYCWFAVCSVTDFYCLLGVLVTMCVYVADQGYSRS